MTNVLIIGAGPTGLGAAWRLAEAKHSDWVLLEGSDHVGGLATSFMDSEGFTWDIGGHVQFSHYEYFDRVMDQLLGEEGWVHHQREAWVWMRERFIPYPLQNNIHHLPPAELEYCLQGLVDCAVEAPKRAKNFKEWLMASFGPGLADVFLLPYNFKVWGYPAEMLNSRWIGERVAAVDLKRVLGNLVWKRDDASWGPNSLFRFPVRGGTGAIWKACADRVGRSRMHFSDPVVSIDLEKREVVTLNQKTYRYDALLSTMPLTELTRLCGMDGLSESAGRGLLHSASNIFGIGLRGIPPEHLRTKCWIYFPEANCPFYRVTVFSNYSPNNVPEGGEFWSLMAEVAESPLRPVDQEAIKDQVIEGLLATGLVTTREEIVSFWQYRAHYGYPTPSLERDSALEEILPRLEERGVFSRGRFGAWKYEVSNQDHSFMQGVECVDRVLRSCKEMTFDDPAFTNSTKHLCTSSRPVA